MRNLSIDNLLSSIDCERFPEAYGYLCQVAERQVDPTPFEMASVLIECDKPRVFPLNLIAFITQLYEMEIEEGNAAAMNDLGSQYYDGHRGFEQNFTKAVKLYQMAAESGNRQAQENLGYCYYYGRDMPVDYEKAFHYFALGAFDGHIISLYKIGDMYLNGYYVKQNKLEAFVIFQHCLQLMNDESAKYAAGPVHLRLGRMYLKGDGIPQNAEQALIHFHAAEYYLYRMVADGEIMYTKSLRASVDGQEEARRILEAALPPHEWTFDD